MTRATATSARGAAGSLKTLLVCSCGLAALGLAIPCGLLGWREWRERTLLRGLDSADPAARKAAALELGRLKCVKAILKLLRLLESEAGSVERFEDYRVAPPPDANRDEDYIPILDGHGNGYFEVHPAARSLREIGAPAVPALAQALSKAENPMFQLQVIHVLRRLRPDAHASAPALTKALDSSNVWVLIHASATLGLMGERAAEALPTLRALVSKHPMGGIFERVIDDIAPGSKQPPP